MHRIVERAIFLSAAQTASKFVSNSTNVNSSSKFVSNSPNVNSSSLPRTSISSSLFRTKKKASLRSASNSQQGPETENPNLEFQDFMQERIAQIRARERQAFLLLGSIIISFVICWAPFFTLYLLRALSIVISGPLFEAAFFIGYCNSAVNPVLYALLNADFKSAVAARFNWFSKFFSVASK